MAACDDDADAVEAVTNRSTREMQWELDQLSKRLRALERRASSSRSSLTPTGENSPTSPSAAAVRAWEDGFPLAPVPAAASLCAHSAEGNEEEVAMLLGLGVPPDVRSYDSRTPLHLAAMHGRVSVCRLLLDAGASCVAVDAAGRTPAALALQAAHPIATLEVCPLLAEAFKKERGNRAMTPPIVASVSSAAPAAESSPTPGGQMGDNGDEEASHLPQPDETPMTSGHCRFREPRTVLPSPLYTQDAELPSLGRSQADGLLSPSKRRQASRADGPGQDWVVGAAVRLAPLGQVQRQPATVLDVAEGFVTVRFEDEELGEQQIPVECWEPDVFGDRAADWRPPLKETRHWHSDPNGLVLVMVGLPGRGKTYIARRLCRWLNWMGIRCSIFNVGKYRRLVTQRASEQTSSFFDPADKGASLERERLAAMACHDLAEFMLEYPGSVGILDATNSTEERRANLLKAFSDVLPPHRIVFVESVCTDQDVIEANILRAKLGNDDYKGCDAAFVLRDFKERISQYEKVYEPLRQETDEGRSWIQLRDVSGQGNSGGKVMINRISGTLPVKLLFFLLNLHTSSVPVYLCRAGEGVHLKQGRLSGASSDLTDKGRRFAAALRQFFNLPDHRHPHMKVMTSTQRRAVKTAKWFTGQERFDVLQYQSLDDMNAGECEGLTLQQIREQFPELWRKRQEDKYNYGWPRGESYADVNARLEPVILDLHKAESPTLVIAHLHTIRGLYAYLAELLPEYCVDIDVGLEQVIEFKYAKHELQVNVYDLSFATDGTPQEFQSEADPLDSQKDWIMAEPAAPPPSLPPPHLRFLRGEKAFRQASSTGGGGSGAGAGPTKTHAPEELRGAMDAQEVWRGLQGAVAGARERVSPQLAALVMPGSGSVGPRRSPPSPPLPLPPVAAGAPRADFAPVRQPPAAFADAPRAEASR
eukprot:TRINITY_DN1038_c0_g1_i1.p1 TRINITY_DN1038_c0_g1~~TRINITY_DN1038_c0_g1_i1.p1  ORF type:complete len:948 (+),score=347.16 TRINITY_DN1038_c0_g1_i1:54-2846(+)